MATQPTTRTEQVKVRNRWTHAVQFIATVECAPDAPLRFKLGLAVLWARKNDADLGSADLRGADLGGADLRGADLGSADLGGADLGGADLGGADLGGADLRGADLRGADLRGADLGGADLRGADLRGAYLRGADLGGAYLGGADLGGAYLRGAQGLTDEQLRPYKADLFLTLSSLRAGPVEARHLVQKLRAGEVDGTTYGHGDRTECACLVGTIAQTRDVPPAVLDHGATRLAEQWFTSIRPGDKPGDGSVGGFAAEKALAWTEEWCAAHGIDPDASEAA